MDYYDGKFESAINKLESARDLADLVARDLNDPTAYKNAACCLNNIGACCQMLGRRSDAVRPPLPCTSVASHSPPAGPSAGPPSFQPRPAPAQSRLHTSPLQVASYRAAVSALSSSCGLHRSDAQAAMTNLTKAVRSSFALPPSRPYSASPAGALRPTGRPQSASLAIGLGAGVGVASLPVTVSASGGRLQVRGNGVWRGVEGSFVPRYPGGGLALPFYLSPFLSSPRLS